MQLVTTKLNSDEELLDTEKKFLENIGKLTDVINMSQTTLNKTLETLDSQTLDKTHN